MHSDFNNCIFASANYMHARLICFPNKKCEKLFVITISKWHLLISCLETKKICSSKNKHDFNSLKHHTLKNKLIWNNFPASNRRKAQINKVIIWRRKWDEAILFMVMDMFEASNQGYFSGIVMLQQNSK